MKLSDVMPMGWEQASMNWYSLSARTQHLL
jgi:hypothetical protein